jgi:thioredoxin 1
MSKFEELIAQDTPTLVDFYATWCGPCRAMHPILEDYKQRIGDSVRVLKLDVDSPANISLSRRYNVSAVPTLLFFRRGEVKWRGSGVVSALDLKKISDSL